MSTDDRDHWNSTWQRGAGSANAFAGTVLEYCGAKKLSILDLGCGTGKDTLYFAGKGHNVTALDFSENSIAALNAAVRQKHLKTVRAIVADIGESLPLKNKTFDVVYAHLSVHYFDMQTTPLIFQEIRRVLVPGGMLFVKCKSDEDPLYGQGEKIAEDTYRTDHVRHFFRKEYMAEMLEGFSIVALRKTASVYNGKQSAFIEAIARK